MLPTFSVKSVWCFTRALLFNDFSKTYNEIEAYTPALGLLNTHIMLLYLIWSMSPGSEFVFKHGHGVSKFRLTPPFHNLNIAVCIISSQQKCNICKEFQGIRFV